VRWIGHELHAEAEIVSDRDLTLAAAHEISETARHELLHTVRRLTDVTIHTSPCAHDGSDPHAATAHHFPRTTAPAAP
jgi:divalent metal cation (Fe/Co/Zn/Cd) transporter